MIRILTSLFIFLGLPTSKLGNFIEGRVNDFLKRKPDVKAGEVTIRVLSSSDKCVEVKPGMKNRYVDTGEWPEQFPYRAKALFAWEEIDGVDVCFFGMHVQEYGSDSSPPNRRRVYLAYLDSVHFFRPKQLRTAVYHEILLGYLDYAKQLGYSMAHIWACPPSEGDDYIFHCHPPEQKIPKPKRLQDWYKKMLDKGLNEKIVVDYKDILKQANEDNFKSPAELPYFEGDFWPNVIEKSLKELEIEKYTQPNSNAGNNSQGGENEDLTGENEGEENSSVNVKAEKDSSTQDEGGSNKKKQSANKKSSKKQNQRKNNVHSSRNKGGQSSSQSQAIANPARAWEAELTNKIYQTMEKHREVFFVIRLHSLADSAKLKPIQDPDGQINCDLMDGRDAFLTMAREKHYEFSSLRRAKFSSLCMLYELHNSSNDRFVYTCNVCKNHLVESRYHCTVCEDYDLCKNCYLSENHMHKMERLEFGELGSAGSGDDSGLGGSISGLSGSSGTGDGSGSAMSKALSPDELKKQSIQRCIQGLVHASNCRDANCRMQSCMKLKRIVGHSRVCKKRNVAQSSCAICRQLIALCCYHAKICEDTQNKCNVPFCSNIKARLKQQQVQARMRQHQLMQSRIRSMTNAVNATAATSTPVAVTTVSPATVTLPPTTKPKPIIPNSQQASLNAAANNMSPGPNIGMTPTGITSSGAGMGKPGFTQMNHVANNCCDSPSPIQAPTQNESMHYIKQPRGNTVIPQRPVMMQQTPPPQQPQRMIRHQMPPQQRPQLQQGPQASMPSRPSMMQQTMQPAMIQQTMQPGPRMVSYQQMTAQPQQVVTQQQVPIQQQMQQPQQQPQQHPQQQQMAWQQFPQQHNNMIQQNMRPMPNAVNVNVNVNVNTTPQGANTVIQQRPTMMQQAQPPQQQQQQQRMMRHPMPTQRAQLQQGPQGVIPTRPGMIQQPMQTGPRMVSYQMGPQGQQMAAQPQQVVTQQQIPLQQQMQQPQQHPQQQQQQQMSWQQFPNQHNNMMQPNMRPMHNTVNVNAAAAAPNMIRPVGLSRVATTRYGHMNAMGHVVGDQDMLAYPNQGKFINRNQQNQQELTPQEKLSHLTDNL